MTRALFILFLFAVAALAADPTVVTKTVKQSGGDYSSLSAWEAGMDDTGDLVASNTISVASIEGDWSVNDYSTLTINGWTTDATRFIVITNSTSKHDGKSYGSLSTAYRLELTNANPMDIREDFIRIYGLQLKVVLDTTARNMVTVGGQNNPSGVVIGNCIFTSYCSDAAGYPIAINVNDADITITIFNCIGHSLVNSDSSNGRFVLFNTAPLMGIVYNCTAFANYRDYSGGASNSFITNCISQNAISAVNAYSGGWIGDYNVSSDGDDPPGDNPADQTVNVVFVSESGTLDVHLDASDTVAKDAGVDVSGSSGFSYDIDGVTRTGSWDIGADEYVAAASGKRVQFLKGLRR